MHRKERRANIGGNAVRAVAVLAVTVGLMGAGGSAGVAAPAPPGDGAASAVSAPKPAVPKPAAPKPGFYEDYRGHHIMGWGQGTTACAYIDGVALVVYPSEGGQFTSAVQGFQPERGLRAITKASVRALGKLKLNAPTDAPAHCPTFASTRKPG